MKKQHHFDHTQYRRNSQKRIYFEDAIYFIATTTYNRFPYFKERIFCDLFLAIGSEVKLIFSTLECNYDYLNAQARRENLKLCKRIKGFQLYAWVIIYDHVHLLIQPNDEFNISKVMQFLKRNVSRNINYITGYNECDEFYKPEGDIDLTPEGDIDQCRLQVKRFIIKKCILKFRFKIKYLNQNPFPKFQWQKSFHDHYIRNENDFMNCMGYIEYNPVKHGLSDKWPYVYTNSKYDDLIDEC